MDYEKEIGAIDEFICREHYKQAGNTMGGILESALREEYGRVRARVTPDDVEVLARIERTVGKGKSHAAKIYGSDTDCIRVRIDCIHRNKSGC